MRRSIWIFAVLLIAIPVCAQDDGQGDAGGFGGGGGGGQAQVFTRVDSVNPIDQVKSFLAKAHITLSGDQEKALRPAAEAAFKQMQETSERITAEFGGGRGGGERGQAVQGGQRRGGFGGNGGGERIGRGAPNSPLTAELRRINDDLVSKINAVLKPDQQATLKKFQSDEIKKAGGFAALKLVMEEAGASLTSEQEQQIQTFYAEDAQQRIQLARESQGRPDPTKAADLEKITMARIVKLLNPAQRKALLDSRTKSQTP